MKEQAHAGNSRINNNQHQGHRQIDSACKPMNNQERSKFSPATINVKRSIRRLRLRKGYSMNEGASLLGISRKQLEDIETVRNYGCHLDLELLAKIKVIYGVSLDDIFGQLPADYYSDYYARPRKKLKEL